MLHWDSDVGLMIMKDFAYVYILESLAKMGCDEGGYFEVAAA